MTHPNTDQGVTAADREFDGEGLTIAYMMGVADEKRHSRAEIASLKQRLESAEGLLKTAYDAGIYLEPVAKGIATFLQEQEKQNG